ncbi:MAG: tetratricopeptide repeat protein, partial [Anaerolineae bacterium]|nr:tetratricopeptide repeat protein [Anaerolineae bacterium]
QALPIYATIGDRLGQANTLKALGDLNVREDRLADARQAYEQALPIYATIGDRLGQANTFRSLADLAARENDHVAALNGYARSAALAEEIGSPYTAAIARASAAPSHAALGSHSEAVSALLEPLLFFDRIGDRSAVGVTVNRLRNLRAQIGTAAFDTAWAQVTGGQPLPDWLV